MVRAVSGVSELGARVTLFPNLDLFGWLARERSAFWDKHYRAPRKLNIGPLQWHFLRFQLAHRMNWYSNFAGGPDTVMGMEVNVVEPVRIME